MAHEALMILRLRSNTGIPADTVEMQFAFQNCNENGGSGGSAATAVHTFLNNGYDTAELSSFLAGSLDHVTPPEYDIYDVSGALSGGHRGSPVASGVLATGLVTPSVDTDLPLQAAIGLSYHANLAGLPEFGPVVTDIPTTEAAVDAGAPATHSGTSRPKASRRGRILFGPLNEAAMRSDSIRIRKPDTVFIGCAIGAMSDLAASTVGWSVWSRRTASFHQITGGWIADETDVVRRRRLKATVRSVWPQPVAIYSRNLGVLRHTGGAGSGTLYTVPTTAGPAVVRSIISTVPAGMLIEIYCSVGGVLVDLVVLDNTAGTGASFKDVETFQPLPPGSEIHWASGGTSANAASVLIGGYQFDAP